jgi:hypothetical protein
MSDILWCDEGNHPFSSTDKQRERYTKQVGVRAPQYTEDVEHFDICGPCVTKKQELRSLPFNPPDDSKVDQ